MVSGSRSLSIVSGRFAIRLHGRCPSGFDGWFRSRRRFRTDFPIEVIGSIDRIDSSGKRKLGRSPGYFSRSFGLHQKL
jgi:hypothetical protein